MVLKIHNFGYRIEQGNDIQDDVYPNANVLFLSGKGGLMNNQWKQLAVENIHALFISEYSPTSIVRTRSQTVININDVAHSQE